MIRVIQPESRKGGIHKIFSIDTRSSLYRYEQSFRANGRRQIRVTGSAGDWTLNFHVSNNTLPGDMMIYFFGVKLDARDIVGSPTNWDPNAWTTWDNSAYGGSSTIYNNNWINFFFDSTCIQPGETLDGFKAHTTVTDMPTSVPYFLFAVSFTGYEYFGDDSFYDGWNPGFEGTATIIPEPMSIAGLGMGVLLLLRRKKA